MADPILVAKTESEDLFLLPQMSNRHGLVAGATGTGKTVTLQVMAEAFSRQGVPVFAPDIKGDLAGIRQPGVLTAARWAAKLMRSVSRGRVRAGYYQSMMMRRYSSA